MKKIVMWGFILSLVLGTLFSPFASSFPDGLERVAENLGFIHKEVSIIKVAPIPDYAVPFVSNEKVATALAGFFGTLLVFGIFYIGGLFLRTAQNK